MTATRTKIDPNIAENATLPIDDIAAKGELAQRFRLASVEGPQAGATYQSTGDRCSVGSHPTNDFVIDDPTVSRFHCEIRISDKGPIIQDLGSLNGTIVDGVRVMLAMLRSGCSVRLASTAVKFELETELNRLPVSAHSEFGMMMGSSVPMRATFALLERASASNATILLEGETGTGKGVAASSIHDQGPRSDGPFTVVDCSAIAANLVESELFGHEKGAFTGAVERRRGAFETASGGTLFLDEIGELSLEMQPKLLRALENREVRRVGSSTTIPVDVRVIAATNRDLRTEVNSGRFRPDLYYRLSVLKISIPPLRDHPEDIPQIVRHLVKSLGLSTKQSNWLCSEAFLSTLTHSSWPGNVRQLRNHLERCAVFGAEVPLADSSDVKPPVGKIDLSVPFQKARDEVTSSFEGAYIEALLRAHKGKVGKAAAAAGMDRVQLWRLMRRYNLGDSRG